MKAVPAKTNAALKGAGGILATTSIIKKFTLMRAPEYCLFWQTARDQTYLIIVAGGVAL